MNALAFAIRFHETYERLAPDYGYETRTDTRKFDAESKNGRLMIAVCGEVLAEIVKDRDEGWALAKKAKRELAELKYPGMTKPIRALDTSPVTSGASIRDFTGSENEALIGIPEAWLQPGGVVPVDANTTAHLLKFIRQLLNTSPATNSAVEGACQRDDCWMQERCMQPDDCDCGKPPAQGVEQ